jgi:hypothetical protein
MAGCRIVNAQVVTAVESISKCSGDYKTAGENFVSEFISAIAEMEGAAKDALQKLINGEVKDFVEKDLPGAVDGMSKLLEGNRDNFEKVDQKLADSIKGE